MEQTDMQPASNSNSDRRVDSSRRRAEAEAAEEQVRLQEEQVRQQDQRERRQDEQVRRQPQEVAQAEAATDPVWQRWWEIQSKFVDDPRSSVAEAHALVSGVVDRVIHQLEEQRSQLEQGWSDGNGNDTEDLRHGLQSYREFLGRLLSKPEERRG